MATFLHNGPCPKCGSKDNLATYDDDSQWCWGCHYYKPPALSGFVAEQRKAELQEDDDAPNIKLPSDLTTDFPEEVVTFIQPYNLTLYELLRYDYSWSPYTGSLWRKLYSSEHEELLVAAEARRVVPGLGKPQRPSDSAIYSKSLFRGSKDSVYPIARPSEEGAGAEQTSIVLVEDSLSSLKVGRVAHSLPLFGTSISVGKIEKLKRKFGYQRVVVWLDHDKFKEAWEIANKFKWLGVGAKVVLTDKDPKFYSEEFIREQTS